MAKLWRERLRVVISAIGSVGVLWPFIVYFLTRNIPSEQPDRELQAVESIVLAITQSMPVWVPLAAGIMLFAQVVKLTRELRTIKAKEAERLSQVLEEEARRAEEERRRVFEERKREIDNWRLMVNRAVRCCDELNALDSPFIRESDMITRLKAIIENQPEFLTLRRYVPEWDSPIDGEHTWRDGIHPRARLLLDKIDELEIGWGIRDDS